MLVSSLTASAAPVGQVFCPTACPMQAAKTSHCGGETLAACCCETSATRMPATELGTATPIAARAPTAVTFGIAEPLASTTRALNGSRPRAPHEHATPLILLYVAFLI